jgi:hypothetical protein
MANDLQDYSKVPLTPEFTEIFATRNFAHIIEEWVLDSSKSISLFVVALARESKGKNSKNSTQLITSFLADNIYFLERQLRDERIKRISMHQGISNTELGFLTFESNGYLVHETLCIFDWIHDFSSDRFLFKNDDAIIHLLFDVSQRDTCCDCEFFSHKNIDDFRASERMLTIRLETPRSFEGPESYFQKWTHLLSVLNEPTVQQRWDEIRQNKTL